MSNSYPQVAVLGCDSRKANLYYDVDRRVWVEHLVSPCVNNEESILKFCQQVSDTFVEGCAVFDCRVLSRPIHRCASGTSFDWILFYVLRIGVNWFHPLMKMAIIFIVARKAWVSKKSSNRFDAYTWTPLEKKSLYPRSIVRWIVLSAPANVSVPRNGNNSLRSNAPTRVWVWIIPSWHWTGAACRPFVASNSSVVQRRNRSRTITRQVWMNKMKRI